MWCKIKVIKEIPDLFPECRPVCGRVYEADYVLGSSMEKNVAIIEMSGKQILLRSKEFELVED